MNNQYFTLQIQHNEFGQLMTDEFKDLTPTGSDGVTKDLNTWMAEIRRNLATTGAKVETSPTSFKFILPHQILSAVLIAQDKKNSL